MSEDGGPNKIEVFVSLADGDKRSLHNKEVWKKLTDCLDALRDEGVVRECFFRAVDAGAPDATVIERLKRSDIIIFALGQSYLDHPERYRDVLKNLPESGRYLVFTLLLYPSDWYDSPFRRFNLLPSSKAPITQSSDLEAEFIEIKEAIKQARLAIYPESSKPRPIMVVQARPKQSKPFESTGSPAIVEEQPLSSGSLYSPEPFNVLEEAVEEESSSIIALPPPIIDPPPAIIHISEHISGRIEPLVASIPTPSKSPDFEALESTIEGSIDIAGAQSQSPGRDPFKETPVASDGIPTPVSPPPVFVPAPEASVEPPINAAPFPVSAEKREPSPKVEIIQAGEPEERKEERKDKNIEHKKIDSISTLNRQELEIERNRIVTDAVRRNDSQPEKEAQQDVVECTVFAPPSASRDGVIFVQVYARLREQAEEALRMARGFDADAKGRAVKSLEEVVERGTRLSFELMMPGLRCAEPVQSLEWRGSPDAAQFAVEVPGDCPVGICVGSVIISAHSVPIGHIKFKLRINQAGSESPAPEAVGEEAKRYSLAFISYASADRSKVLARVQMLNLVGIRFFQDVLSLKPGDKWETEIYRNIDSCDIFLLFWSKAARDSDWVMNEVRYAKNRPQPPEIKPIILEGPPIITPPEDLNDLHFDDRSVYFILDQRS